HRGRVFLSGCLLTTPCLVCIIICSQVAISRRAGSKGAACRSFCAGAFSPHGGFESMSKLKRTLAALAAACLTLALLAGCSPSAPENTGASSAPGGGDETTLRVVATIFPIYDWAREVLGQVPG